MSPFVQELVSFISILAGVITLTSWVMWILLRPSGDSKAKDFAQKSAKDGLTRCVMENNDLKNTVKRLERENKVLMSAGYGHKSESVVTKDEKLESVKEEKGKDLAGRSSMPDENSTGVGPAAEPAVQKPLDLEPEPEAALHKVTDEAEKKKIADYMANVEKATERQKEEIKKVESWKRSGPYGDDDLKMIRGIGPHIEKMLKKAGITSFRQISKFNEDDIRLVSDAIGSFPRRIAREEWVEQAKVLVGKGIK